MANPATRRMEVADTKTRTQITQVGTVIVPVSDQDRALEFYVGTLGFEMRMDAPFGDGGRWVEVGPPGAAKLIGHGLACWDLAACGRGRQDERRIRPTTGWAAPTTTHPIG